MSIDELTRIVNRVSTGLPSVSLMRTRESEFHSRLEMKIAGIAADPTARFRLDDELQEFWYETRFSSEVGVEPDEEVVIGSGIHAAIYAATRVQAGFKPPIFKALNCRMGFVNPAP